MDKDIFRPWQEPARTLYDAFQAEAEKRKGRSIEEWTRAEICAVHQAAERVFPAHGLQVPTVALIESAQTYAMGSIDYGLTWVARVVNEAGRVRPGERGTRAG